MGCESALRVESCCYGISGGRERDEERVALRIDLGAIVARECPTEKAAVRSERLGVSLAEHAEERCRALDVGEEERHGPGPPHGLTEVESVVLVEDLPLEPLQGGAGFDPELVDDCSSAPLVDVEGVRLAANAVEREHQLRAQAFAELVLGHEPFQFRNERAVTTGGQFRVDSFLHGREA